jgi:hypothetical protein
MKNIRTLLVSIVAIAAVAACSKWTQDPLDGQNRAFQHPTDHENKPGSDPAPDSRAIIFDTGDFYSTTEQQPVEVPMKVRSIDPAVPTPVLSIENLADFGASATFDPAAGKFVWTPPAGTVVGSRFINRELHVLASAVRTDGSETVVFTRKTINLRVEKLYSAPIIKSVTKSSDAVHEGQTARFTVQIEDRDAGVDSKTWPVVQLTPSQYYSNLAALIDVGSTISKGNGIFEIYLTADLRGVELTKNKDNYGFTLRTASQFNAVSMPTDVSIIVLTALSDMQTTWFDTLEIHAGQPLNYQFVIYDPKDEAYIAPPAFNDLPEGAEIKCQSAKPTRQDCRLTWNPPKDAGPSRGMISADLELRNQNPYDDLVKVQRMNLRYKIIAAEPEPTPTPKPKPPKHDLLNQGGDLS